MEPGIFERCQRHAAQCDAGPGCPLLLRIAKRAALEQLLTAAETATPWYGQLMTTPQTIAWFVQLNYWLQKIPGGAGVNTRVAGPASNA